MVTDLEKLKKIKVIAIAVAITFITGISYVIYAPVRADDAGKFEVEIYEGQGLNQIASTLKNKGLIRSKTIFILYVRMMGDATNLRAGRYIFTSLPAGRQGYLNVPVIINILVSGKSEPDDIKITIPEGLNVWEVDELLIRVGLIQEGQFSAQYYNQEGYLFPDTYRLKKQQEINSEEQIGELREKMSLNFNNKTEELFKNLSNEQKFRIIIIASMLEKEAKTEEDMKLVAGIIEKRLNMDIPLQIDATVTYGACRREFTKNNFIKNCDVTFQGPAIEIKIDGPFNTYIRKGLPPAPISNPGLKAIEAALNPQESDYLYYLSTRDGSQMIYSKTAGEHEANRRKYLGI